MEKLESDSPNYSFLSRNLNESPRSISPVTCSCKTPSSISKINQSIPLQTRFISDLNATEKNLNAEDNTLILPSTSSLAPDTGFPCGTQCKPQALPLLDSNRRTRWIRLLRLQLNSTHGLKTAKTLQYTSSNNDEMLSNSTNMENSQISSNGHNIETLHPIENPSISLNHRPITLNQVSYTSDSSQSSAAHWSSLPTANNLLTQDPSQLSTSHPIPGDKPRAGKAWRKRTANVRGRFSNFWRQVAIAAVRNQNTDTGAILASYSPKDTCDENVDSEIHFRLRRVFKQSWPNQEQIDNWRHSFKNLLHDKHGLLIFREFLRGEFSDENIEFWIACKEYKALTNDTELRRRAQQIYEDYIAFQSQREINLDCETRLQTERRFSLGERDLFDASQKRIEALMEKDPYRRFLRSSLYLKLREYCKHELSTSSTSSSNVCSRFSNPIEGPSEFVFKMQEKQQKQNASSPSNIIKLEDSKSSP